MKWWLVYLLLTSSGVWENPEGFGPQGMTQLWQCQFLGDYWHDAHGIGENENLSCVQASTADEAIELSKNFKRIF